MPTIWTFLANSRPTSRINVLAQSSSTTAGWSSSQILVRAMHRVFPLRSDCPSVCRSGRAPQNSWGASVGLAVLSRDFTVASDMLGLSRHRPPAHLLVASFGGEVLSRSFGLPQNNRCTAWRLAFVWCSTSSVFSCCLSRRAPEQSEVVDGVYVKSSRCNTFWPRREVVGSWHLDRF